MGTPFKMKGSPMKQKATLVQKIRAGIKTIGTTLSSGLGGKGDRAWKAKTSKMMFGGHPTVGYNVQYLYSEYKRQLKKTGKMKKGKVRTIEEKKYK